MVKFTRKLTDAMLVLLLLFLGHCSVYGKTKGQTICINPATKEALNVSCRTGEVIMRLEVEVGWTNRPGSRRCVEAEDDCRGTTPDVITKVNECYWQPDCQIRLNPYMPIIGTVNNNMTCLGKPPSWATLKNYQCINESKVKYVCRVNDSPGMVNETDGILVSHRTYPWHYAVHNTCRITLTPPSGYSLSVQIEDIDIDPENTDTVKFNIQGTNRSIIINNTYPTGVAVPIGKANLEIVFSIGTSSKSGRGFLIRFKSLPPGAICKAKDLTKFDKKCQNRNRKGKCKGKKQRQRKGKKGKHKGGKGKRRRKNKGRKNGGQKSTTRKKSKRKQRRKKKKVPTATLR